MIRRRPAIFISGSAGSIIDMQGEVQETNRRYYEVTGQSEKQGLREDYDLADFGMDGGYASYGFSLENAGRLWTLQWDMMAMNPSTDSVAIRNYYIFVSDIEYGGQSYEYMQIPEGTAFSVDMFAILGEIRGLCTPFTFKPSSNFRLIPFIDIGLFIFYASYDIDAGPAQGVIQYLDPPEDFVVGGQGTGSLAAGLPELGAGLEMRIGSDAGPNFVFQANYAWLDYNGSTEWLLSSSHRAKDLELKHVNAKVRLSFELPMEKGRAMSLGVQYHSIESEASVTSEEGLTDEEVAERHERFDKDAYIKITSLMATLGFTF
ncbi:hypothetical protein ACFLQU_02355 [Verrucomicrobiota bacterium]